MKADHLPLRMCHNLRLAASHLPMVYLVVDMASGSQYLDDAVGLRLSEHRESRRAIMLYQRSNLFQNRYLHQLLRLLLIE